LRITKCPSSSPYISCTTPAGVSLRNTGRSRWWRGYQGQTGTYHFRFRVYSSGLTPIVTNLRVSLEFARRLATVTMKGSRVTAWTCFQMDTRRIMAPKTRYEMTIRCPRSTHATKMIASLALA
jgi:hypothetical protein